MLFLSFFRPAILALGIATVFLTEAPGADWPEFRGPTAQGLITSTSLPISWHAASNVNVAWKQSIPGGGWSSPVLKNGRIYLTTAVPEGGSDGRLSLRVLCLDESTGKPIWNNEILAPSPKQIAKIHSKNSQASATPLIAGDRLYAHFGHLGTACLKLDGTVLWKNDGLHYPPVHGNGGSPVLVDGVLIFSCDGASDPFIVGVDATDGHELWRTRRLTTAKKTFSFSTPLVIGVGGQSQIVTPGSGVVCALEPKTGREIWRVRYAEGYSVVPRPVYSEKHRLIILSSGFDRPVLLAVRPGGEGDVTETHVAWQLSKGAPNTPSPLVVEDEVYVVSDGGIASCIDVPTGEVHWQERVGGNYSASPVFAGGRVYFQSEEGTCVVVKAGRTFEKLAENPLGERSLASFAAGSDSFYIRTAENLFKISAR
jgi:outer membrane protein assembly factor BamB